MYAEIKLCNVADLVPQPPHIDTLTRNREGCVPERSGCYGLSIRFQRSSLYRPC